MSHSENAPGSEAAELVNTIRTRFLSRGWIADDQMTPTGWRPDLILTNGRGSLLCIEVKAGQEKLRLSTISSLRKARNELTHQWPGESIFVLMSTEPVSPRLEAALTAWGIL